MFGEYMVYVNDKPVLLVCDNTVYFRKRPDKYLPEIAELLSSCDTGCPYDGAREHYILDMENAAVVRPVVEALERITPVPKPKKTK